MDIMTLALTASGAFGAGLTVGALVLSPRLITITRDSPAPAVTPHIYVIPGTGAPQVTLGITSDTPIPQFVHSMNNLGLAEIGDPPLRLILTPGSTPATRPGQLPRSPQ